jgi:hypothetical protein
MPHDTTHPGLARPLTALVFALIIALSATAATAAAALAVKEPPTINFATATPGCDYLGDEVAAIVNLGFDGKGRWTYVEAKAVATDAAGTTFDGPLIDGDKYDMHMSTPLFGVQVSTSNGSVTTKILVRLLDRRGTPLQEAWTESPSYTCPETGG